MSEPTTKTPSDAKLIQSVFKLDPLDWVRFPDGRLVFIAQDGRKFSYTQQQIDQASKNPPAKPSESSSVHKTAPGMSPNVDLGKLMQPDQPADSE